MDIKKDIMAIVFAIVFLASPAFAEEPLNEIDPFADQGSVNDIDPFGKGDTAMDAVQSADSEPSDENQAGYEAYESEGRSDIQ